MTDKERPPHPDSSSFVQQHHALLLPKYKTHSWLLDVSFHHRARTHPHVPPPVGGILSGALSLPPSQRHLRGSRSASPPRGSRASLVRQRPNPNRPCPSRARRPRKSRIRPPSQRPHRGSGKRPRLVLLLLALRACGGDRWQECQSSASPSSTYARTPCCLPPGPPAANAMPDNPAAAAPANATTPPSRPPGAVR